MSKDAMAAAPTRRAAQPAPMRARLHEEIHRQVAQLQPQSIGDAAVVRRAHGCERNVGGQTLRQPDGLVRAGQVGAELIEQGFIKDRAAGRTDERQDMRPRIQGLSQASGSPPA
jgi:hypothetical protein